MFIILHIPTFQMGWAQLGFRMMEQFHWACSIAAALAAKVKGFKFFRILPVAIVLNHFEGL